jgi:O-acetyl-ADP-ribose deacetylase (regulator of RNase III)
MIDAPALEKELGGRYRVTGLLGEGANGTVFRARHIALHRDVAIKVLAGHAGDDAGERLLREARIAARIQSPYVVACFDFGLLASRSPFMVMELVDGPSLAAKIGQKDEQPLPIDQLVRFMTDAARGMAAAGELGVMHRDLKPANMLIAPTGELKIADFGLARLTATTGPSSLRHRPLTAMGMVLGTPYFMAPEQAWNPNESDTRADIYGYGASFYFAATGRRPFEHTEMLQLLIAHRSEIPARPRSLRPDLPEYLQAILERCLAKDPRDRFQSFEAIEAALKAGDGPRGEADFDPALGEHAAYYRQIRQSLLAGGPPSPLAIFRFEGDRALSIVRTDIASVAADALVSSDDGKLSMRAGVAAALNAASGGVCHAETRKFVPVRQGGVVVTSAGSLRARFVFHAITLDWDHAATYRPSRDILLRLLSGCLYQADTLRLQSLALPLLGTGNAGFSAAECLDATVELLVKAMLRGATGLSQVTLVLLPTALS